MQKVDLNAEERKEKGKKLKHLRSKGLLPAVVYGHDQKAISLALDYKTYKKTISGDSGTNVIINLTVDGAKEPIPVITHDIQYNHLDDSIIHVDFQKINMKEKIHTHIPVELIGTAIGVKEEAGILVHSLTELEIKCLPMDIPDKVELDISALSIGQSFQVSDLRAKLVAEIEILTEETENVVQVVAPAKEEEPTPVAVEGEIPSEGEAPAEGAAPAEGEAPVAEKAEPAKESK